MEPTVEYSFVIGRDFQFMRFVNNATPSKNNNKTITTVNQVAVSKDNKQDNCVCEERIKAYMRMLRIGEGTEGEKGYTKLFGGDNFTKPPHNKNMSDHPNIKVYWYTKKNGDKVYSSATGAYQVMGYIWNDVNMENKRTEYGITDFTPENQDLFCILLFIYHPSAKNMLDLIMEGKIKEANEKGSYIWASLPPGRYGQPAATMEESINSFNEYFESEKKGISDLHLKKGFLEKFNIACHCHSSIISNNMFCNQCKETHIDLRNKIEWQTQYNSKWGNKSKQDVACKKTCDAILISAGLKETNNNTPRFQTAVENSNHTELIINTEESKKAIEYLNKELIRGNPILVGIDHKLNYKYNEGTTDHFLVIVGKGCEKGNIYYLFYEVATAYKNKGTSDANKLYLNLSDYSLKGIPEYNNKRKYTVTQVRKNM